MSLRFVLVIQAPPGTQGAFNAYHYAEALLSSGHSLTRVFFYGDGVWTANALLAPPQDEFNACKAWQTLQQRHQLDLVVCIAAAARRGILNQEEARRYEKASENLAAGFELSGLGQLADGCLQADRVVTFGR